MWFKTVLLNGWPSEHSDKVEIQDPSDESEVLGSIQRLMPSSMQNHQVEIMRREDELDLVIRERPNGAVMGHLVSC